MGGCSQCQDDGQKEGKKRYGAPCFLLLFWHFSQEISNKSISAFNTEVWPLLVSVFYLIEGFLYLNDHILGHFQVYLFQFYDK